jgi:spore germination protein (amino acid permease)
MLQRKKVTSLIINAIAVKMLLTYPRNIVLNSGNGAWIQVLYNLIVTILIFTIIAISYRGRKNVIQLAECCGGKLLKIVVGVIVLIILTANLISIMRIFPETIKIILLQEGRVEIILAIFAIVAAIGAYMGIESIATVQYLFLPIAGIVMISFLLLLIPYYKLDNLFPILGNGAKNIFFYGLNSMSIFSDVILLNILLPYMENYREFKRSGFKSIIIGGIVVFIIMLAYCSVYPYPASKNFILPVYQLTRMIHLSSFFSRFETFFQFVWSILMMLYASFYICVMCYVWQTTFNLKFQKPLIAPIVIVVFEIAIIPNSIMEFMKFEKIINYVAYPFAFLLPIIFAAASRKIYGEKHEKN